MQIAWKPPGPVALEFVRHRPKDPLPVDILLGPVGSGKTTACVVRLFLHALEAPRCSDGWRRTRFAIVRNTGPMLETTTIPAVLSWLPDGAVGELSPSPPRTFEIAIPELRVRSSWWFLPLERPEDVRRLLSLDLTGAWINELREVPREIVVELRRRCGRYPPRRDIPDPADGVPWNGIIADTNAPKDAHHWLSFWLGLSEVPDWLPDPTIAVPPDGMRVFRQPPAAFRVEGPDGRPEFVPNPDAENLRNLPPGYYEAQLRGSALADTLCMLCCVPARAGASRPVHPHFRRSIHVGPVPDPFPGRTVFVGLDVGRDPAAVFAQRCPRTGCLFVHGECIGTNVSVRQFVRTKLLPALQDRFGPDAPIRAWADPAGAHRTGGDDTTPILHARDAGLPVVPAPSNDPERRRLALETLLIRMHEGSPAIRVDPRCETLIAALEGGFRYRDDDPDRVEKNRFSHVAEALEYLCLGLDPHGLERAKAIRSAAKPGRPAVWDPLRKRSVPWRVFR